MDEVKAMLDQEYGNSELMAECARDIQNILAGKRVFPNEAANTAYAQKLVDFMKDQSENLKPEQNNALEMYFEAIQPVIMRNMTRNINETLASE